MQQVSEQSVHHRSTTAQTHEDLQRPPQEGCRQGHCRRHRWCCIWKKKKSKSKDLPADLQSTSQSSQGGSQSSPCHSQCTKEKATATPQKSDSPKKKKCSSSHKHCGKSSKDKDESASAMQPSPAGPTRTSVVRPAKKVQ